MSTQEWLERTVQRPLVRQFVAASAHTLTYSAALDQVSAEVFMVQAQSALKNNVRFTAVGGGLSGRPSPEVLILTHIFEKDLDKRLDKAEILHRSLLPSW
jgi:hypothetical protein